MTIYKTTFQEVRIHRSKSGKCIVCGKRAVRHTSRFQTLNPFNTNAFGVPKTRREIVEELFALLDEWEKEPVNHSRCE